jgi:hypothetical protein
MARRPKSPAMVSRKPGARYEGRHYVLRPHAPSP